MGEPYRLPPPFWIPEKDRKGRIIEQDLLGAAQRLWPRAYSQTVRELHDGSWASEIFESAVFAVSNVIHRNGHRGAIRNLDAYLHWAFSRKLSKRVIKEKLIQFVDAQDLMQHKQRAADEKRLSDSNRDLLISQVMCYMDVRTKRIFLLRAGGRSWKRIAHELGTNVNNAAGLFKYGMAKARDRILKKAISKAGVPLGRRG